jgi:hypothetical protein
MGKGQAKPHDENQDVTKCYTGPRNWTDPSKRPKQWNMGMRFRIEKRGVSIVWDYSRQLQENSQNTVTFSERTRGQMGQG